jgi:hypothetical protein
LLLCQLPDEADRKAISLRLRKEGRVEFIMKSSFLAASSGHEISFLMQKVGGDAGRFVRLFIKKPLLF